MACNYCTKSCPDYATANDCQAQIDANVAKINQNNADIASYRTLCSNIDDLSESISGGLSQLYCAYKNAQLAITDSGISGQFDAISDYYSELNKMDGDLQSVKAEAQSEITRLTDENADLARRNNQLAAQKAAALAKTCTECC